VLNNVYIDATGEGGLARQRLVFSPVAGADYRYDFEKIVQEINRLAVEDTKRFIQFCRFWCQESLFFLCYFVLRMPVNHSWIVDRINDVEELNDRTLDLWAREHFKSSIITYGLNIQEILKDSNVRIGIFSHTRTIAKAFLRRIKLTFESNEFLKAIFPDVLYQNPTSQSPKWSEDEGIIVNRQNVFQEATVEAWGLVDSQPTSKHFSVLNYDDVVTRESVSTPDQLSKVDECFRLSFNLGAEGGKKRVIGTIYHFNDQYCKMIKEGGWVVRKHPAEAPGGRPVLLSKATLLEKRRDMGPYVYNTQMLLTPSTKEDQRFRPEWLQFYRRLPKNLTLILLCDPANSKKQKTSGSDYTVYWLWGLDSLGNKYLVDAVRDRLTLTERWTALKELVAKYRGTIARIGYEQYGMAADIQHFEEMMASEGFYFSITELGGNKLSKEDRVLRLVPHFEQKRVWLPEYLNYTTKDGQVVDLVRVFVEEEYLAFPFSQHDDMLDAASRIEDKYFSGLRPYDSVDDVSGAEAFDGYESVYDSDFVNGLFGYNKAAGLGDAGRCTVTGY
jgi:phage terminase large subunit-like protein